MGEHQLNERWTPQITARTQSYLVFAINFYKITISGLLSLSLHFSHPTRTGSVKIRVLFE